MYYLMIWDKELASMGRDGCLNEIEIPLGLANFFFRLNVKQYPILSSLSFDDYDMFSGEQIDSLLGELFSVASINPLISEGVQLMVSLMLKARSLGKNILFDPFKVG
ncbi:hypothetical protein [Pseudomonas cremoricolorata]|uniref:Uncharacterized protein n=1 Tax=Pseudomonas cremoricolorata TaxID=157783 RepID=A0A089WQS8_9PSED|nr:hypothetical protein [Pseudomonas cremoricolorata]AIR88837.1 hypothetical protein LK03_05945 [Pseudomonas cremoricolorata]